MGLDRLVGDWELAVDLSGANDTRGLVRFELLGSLLVQNTEIPDPNAPDSVCVVLTHDDGTYTQHYFDSRGVARLYDMTLDGDTWTLLRSKADFSPLSFQQRFVGSFTDDDAAIVGEWQTSLDGTDWQRDFGLTYRRL